MIALVCLIDLGYNLGNKNNMSSSIHAVNLYQINKWASYNTGDTIGIGFRLTTSKPSPARISKSRNNKAQF